VKVCVSAMACNARNWRISIFNSGIRHDY